MGKRDWLLNHYTPRKEWAVIGEVPIWQGREKRFADALVVNTHPSRRAIQVHGYEIKSGRGDWVGELNDPDKAETAASYCTQWWLALEREGVIDSLDQVPPQWGVVLFKSPQESEVLRHASQLNPRPLTREILAACVRKLYEKNQDLESQIESLESDRRTIAELEFECRKGRRALNAMEMFEQHSGLNPYNWNWDGLDKDLEVARTIRYSVERCMGDKTLLLKYLENQKHGAIERYDRFKEELEQTPEPPKIFSEFKTFSLAEYAERDSV